MFYRQLSKKYCIDSNYLTFHGITLNNRRKLISYLIKLYPRDHHTIFYSMYLFDYYLSLQKEKVDKKDLKKIITVCSYFYIKLHRKFIYTSNDLTHLESKIFHTVQGSLFLPSLDIFLDFTNQGSTNQGSTNQGSTNQGSTNQGSTNQGSTNQGSTNIDLFYIFLDEKSLFYDSFTIYNTCNFLLHNTKEISHSAYECAKDFCKTYNINKNFNIVKVVNDNDTTIAKKNFSSRKYKDNIIIYETRTSIIYQDNNFVLKRVKNYDYSLPFPLLREVAHLKEINHPNIIKIHDLMIKNNYIYIVLPYYPYKLLECVNNERIDSYIKQLINVLIYLKEIGIIHKDINPNNIVVDANKDKVYLVDFGCSCSKYSNDTFGTVPYQAPELKHSFPSDVWSLGCVIVEMITKTPFFTEQPNYNNKQINDKLKKLNIPNKYYTLIVTMLETDPEKRITPKKLLKLI